MPIKKPNANDLYLLSVFVLVTVIYIAFFMGLLGCTRTSTASEYDGTLGPVSMPLYEHVPAPPPGWISGSDCIFGGVEVFYKGNTTYVCYKQPTAAEDKVYLIEVCPGMAGRGRSEQAVCVNNVVYGPRGESDLLYEFQPGPYENSKTGYSCSFKVKPGCEIENAVP